MTQDFPEGVLLSNEERYKFVQLHLYTKEEIIAFEKRFQIILPDDYKHFLMNVGSCKCFVNKYGLGIEIRELDKIAAYMKDVFIEMNNPFPNLLLTVSLTGRGDEGGFNLTRKEPNFSIFSHEEDPELWTEETDKWVSFSNWLIKLVKSEGQNDLP